MKRLVIAYVVSIAAAAQALEPGALTFSNTYALSAFDGLSGFLVGTNGFRLGGAGDNSQLGAAVSAAGDVNGDGHPDLLVGAPQMDIAATFRAGRAYVVFGGTPLLPDQPISVVPGFRVDGSAADDNAGASVAGGGDFNGDGIDDVAVGIPNADPAAGTNAGIVAVIFGATNLPATFTVASLAGTNGFTLIGETTNARAGATACFVGDVNGDGRDDLLVGSPDLATPGTSGVGRAYLIFGSTNAAMSLALSALNGTNGCVLTGDDSADAAGAALAALGDFDSDGLRDIAVGAPTAGSLFEGRCYVVFGRTNWPSRLPLSTLNGTNGFRCDGNLLFSSFGSSLAGADVNGDGRADLLIGARNQNRVYAFYGTTNRQAVRSSLALDGTNGTTWTSGALGAFGTTVARIGHVNADGYDDVLIGAPSQPTTGSVSRGNAYLVMGAASFSATTDVASLADGKRGFLLSGQQAFAEAGQGIVGAGDWDGDGFDDLLIGERLFDYGTGPSTNAGAAYLFSPLASAEFVVYRPEIIGFARSNGTNYITWLSQTGVTCVVETNRPGGSAWSATPSSIPGAATAVLGHVTSGDAGLYRVRAAH